MGAFSAGRVWSLVAGVDLVIWLLGLGLTAFTIALVVLIWTRWGQYRPVQKCLVLSLAAHLLLAGYATTVKIVGLHPLRDDATLQISLIDGPGGSGGDGDPAPTAAEKTPLPLLDIPGPAVPPPPPQFAKAVLDKPIAPPADPPKPKTLKSIEPPKPAGMAEDTVATAPASADRVPAAATQPQSDASGKSDAPAATASDSTGDPRRHCRPSIGFGWRRIVRDLAQGRGGSPESESAVQAALRWLARSQAPTATGACGSMKGAGPPRPTAATAVTPASRRTPPPPVWPCWRFSPRARRIATAATRTRSAADWNTC